MSPKLSPSLDTKPKIEKESWDGSPSNLKQSFSSQQLAGIYIHIYINVKVYDKTSLLFHHQRRLGFNSGNINDKNGTYDKIISVVENDITNEHKEYLSNHYSIKPNSKMETLTSMC